MERTIERALVRECRRRGWLAIKLSSPGLIGLPDRLVLMPGGQAVFLEVKQPGGRVSRQQQLWIQRLKALGVQAHIVWSAEEGMEVLNGIAGGV